MADAAVLRSPITDPLPADGSLWLVDRSATTKSTVRAAPGTAAAAALGVPFARSERRAEVLVVGSRPDEWTLLGPARGVAALTDGLDLSGFASVVDTTHSRLMIRFGGDGVTRALEKVCAVDFDDSMTPDGAAFGAFVAKVTCDLVRNDIDGVPSFLILAGRSYGQYLWDALRDCAAEF